MPSRRHPIHVPYLVDRLRVERDGEVDPEAIRQSFNQIMSELHRYLRYLQDGDDAGLPAGAFEGTPTDLDVGEAAILGDPELGWIGGGHTHGLPTGTPSLLGDALAEGTSTRIPRLDHIHKRDITPIPGGRLTTSSGVPVLIVDVVNSTSIFYTPYLHDQIPFYDGTFIRMNTFTELTNTTTDAVENPAAVAADSNYDLFVWDDAGTLRLTRGPLWTSDTTRGVGAGTTELVRVKGLLLNAVAITNGPPAERGTYVGTFRSDATSTIDWKFGGTAPGGDSAYFNVWNMYNRISTKARVEDSTLSWTYGVVGAWRATNASGNNRVSYVVGQAEDDIDVVRMSNVNAAGGSVPYVGIGLDSVVAKTGITSFHATGFGALFAYLTVNSLGFHFIQSIEFNNGLPLSLALFYGDIGLPLVAQTTGLIVKGMW